MNIENRVIFYLVFFIVMQVITLLSRKNIMEFGM